MRTPLSYLVFFCWLTVGAFAEQTVLVDLGSEWKFLAEDLDENNAWKAVGFDDSAWGSGAAPIGFGDDDIVTDIRELPVWITAYFRIEFVVSAAELAGLEKLIVEMRRDDGAVVYLNGVEIRRDNLPDGDIAYNTMATGGVNSDDEDTYFRSEHSTSRLVAGINILSVEVHNVSAGSPDFMLDLRLTGDTVPRFFGSSRPPCLIDFETPEFSVTGGIGVRRSLAAEYTGIEYTYNRAGGNGDIFRTQNEIFGASFDSNVLAANRVDFGFDTFQVDLQNYKDVQVAFDLRVDGSITSALNRIVTSFDLTSESRGSETIAWRAIKQPPASSLNALFHEDAAIRYQVPTSSQAATSEWVATDFNDSSWSAGTLGIGYERSAANTYNPYLGSDIESLAYNKNSSVIFRVPFTLSAEDLDGGTGLFLDMRYDDGFVAFLNGAEIAQMNAPDPLFWNSEATATHSDLEAIEYQRFPVEGGAGILQVGENILAVHGLNRPRTSSDFLIQPQLLLAGGSAEVDSEEFDFYRGEFKTIQTEPGFLSDDLTSLILHVDGTTDVNDEAIYYIDNIRVTGTPIAPDSFTTAIALEAGLDGIDTEANPDPDGDGLPLLLEYAFGGSFVESDDSATLLPQVEYDELGFLKVQFRMLEGFRSGDADGGYDVADLLYTPQLSYDLANWRDGSGVPPFEEVGEIVKNDDGTVTVSLQSRRRLQEEQVRAYFRVLVEVARPAGVVLTNGGS